MALTLKFAGTEYTPSALLASGLKLTLKSLAADVLTFTVPCGESIASQAQVSAGDVVELWQDGTRIFAGTALDPKVSLDGGVWRRTITAEGPWRRFERMVALQSWTTIDYDTETTTSANKSRILYGAIYESGTGTVWVKTGRELKELLTWATSSSGPNIPVTIGTIFGATLANSASTGIYTPTSEGVDQSIAEVLRTILQWHPAAVSWWDYSTTLPTLHIAEADTLQNLSISAETRGLLHLDVQARGDLVIPVVQVIYERVKTVTLTGGAKVNREYCVFQTNPGGANVLADGALIYSIDWKSKTTNPPDVAGAIRSASSTLQHSGSFTLGTAPGSIHSTAYVGHSVSIDYGPPEANSVFAPVSEVSYDVDAGRTQVSFGPTGRLTGSQWLALLTRSRKQSNGLAGVGSLGTADRPDTLDDVSEKVEDLIANPPSGVPDGYVEQTMTYSANGTLATGSFLVKSS